MAKQVKRDTLVYEVKLSVVISLDGRGAPITKAVIAENTASWLRTLIETGEVEGAVDSFKLIDAYDEAV